MSSDSNRERDAAHPVRIHARPSDSWRPAVGLRQWAVGRIC